MNILTLTFIIMISIAPYILSIAALVIALVALSRTRRAPVTQPAGTPRATPASADTPAPIAPEILAVIAAAVSMVCGPDARIVDVNPAGATGAEGAGAAHPWALEGRRALHATHRPR